MSSNECYHFTKLNRAYQIAQNGLMPRVGKNSEAVGDAASKISFSDGKLAAVGILVDFYSVYKDMNTPLKKGGRQPIDKKVVTSTSLEDYLGQGIYLIFDGTEIENEGGNKGHINPFDAGTTKGIPPEDLKVCVLKDSSGKIHYSQYEVFKYFMANLTEEDERAIKEMLEGSRLIPKLKKYREDHKEDIEKYKTEKFEVETMSLDVFCKTYKDEIDEDIKKYLDMHKQETEQIFEKLKREFANMPSDVRKKNDVCKKSYDENMAKLEMGDFTSIEIPILDFYEAYKKEFDPLVENVCQASVDSLETEISSLREEIDKMLEYKELFLHSAHHIKNVVEFAYIIGKTEGTLGDDLDLLIQAAKYHDSGREGSEWLSENHADPSAKHAGEVLGKTGKYTAAQIAMIQTAISYHEHSERFKNEFDEEYFLDISKQYGVPEEKLGNARLMCIYLKDADALDRVRLGNLDKSYLRTAVAKSDFFLREYGKPKKDIDWEKAGLTVRRNKDFDFKKECRDAYVKLKRDYSGNETISNAIRKVESKVVENKDGNKVENPEKVIFGKSFDKVFGKLLKNVRHILQIEKMVNRVTENTDGIVTISERKEEYLKLCLDRFFKADLDVLELRLADVVRLSEIPRKDEMKNVPTARISSEIEKIKTGMNDNRKVQFVDEENNSHTGYFKENIIPIFNDSSIAVQKIADLLGVQAAKTYVCEYEGKKGIISQDVAEGSKEFVTMKEVIKESKIKPIDFTNAERAKSTEYNPSGMVKSANEIEQMLDRPLVALGQMEISEENMQEITKNYVKMICFDYLTNQTDRNDGNYGILKADGQVSFAPLIDCDYILHDPSDTDNDINFTGSVRCDRDVLMEVVAKKYPNLVQEFYKSVAENNDQILGIITDSFSPEMQEKYGNIVKRNIVKMSEIVKQVKDVNLEPKKEETSTEKQTEQETSTEGPSKEETNSEPGKEEALTEKKVKNLANNLLVALEGGSGDPTTVLEENTKEPIIEQTKSK